MQVKFEGIDKQYGDFFAVRDLNLTIEDGELHFLLGPSGCGKTTTLRMLAGLEKPTRGRILFDGVDVTQQPSAERGIGMVFQNYALWPHMTVFKNVEYGLKLRKLSPQEVRSRIDEVLDFTQLNSFADRFPGQLSGGQQQRVALARALAIRPNVLLLDEPLSNLDAKLRLEMRDNISRIHKSTGITTVYVTHDQKEALSMGSKISVMRAGERIQTDSPRRLYHRPKNAFIAGFIGETNLLSGTFEGKDGDDFVVATEGGTVRTRWSEGQFDQGEKVTLSFRPETLRVNFDGRQSGVTNAIKARVEHLTYLGESEQFQVLTQGENRLKASVFNAPEHGLSDGDEVTCFVDPQDILMLPSHTDLRSGT